MDFQMSPRVWISLGRSIPGILALAFSSLGMPVAAAWCLVFAVWADVAGGWIFRGPSSVSVQACDAVVDCVCFVAAPASFVMSSQPRVEMVPAVIVFALAGLFRLARFQVEGLVRGGYRGLPVTYNGYIFPAAALCLSYSPEWSTPAFWSVLLLLSAGLMVSTFIVPEI